MEDKNSKFNYPLPDLSKVLTGDSNEHTPLEDYIFSQLLALLTQKQNLHGRRIGQAKDAVKPKDYITKRQVTFNLVGTLASRPAAKNYPQGTTFYATDRKVTYIIISGNWFYRDGVQSGTLSSIPSPHVTRDVGYRFYATDYDWEYLWLGTGWLRVGGANNFIQGFKSAPTKAGWGLCDGSVYTSSTDAAGTSSITSPDLITTGKFCKFDAAYAASVAAIVPTISGNTGSSGLHTHDLTPLGHLTGSVSGNLPDHTHTVGTDNIGTGSIFISDAKSSQSGHVGDPWTATGDISGNTDSTGSHTHSFTALGSTTGNMPNHTHVAPNTYTGPAKTSGGAAGWTGNSAYFTVSGAGGGGVGGTATIGGTLDLPDHTHGLSTLFISEAVTGDNSVGHHHAIGNSSGTFSTSGSFTATAVADVDEVTGPESAAHQHGIDIDFTGYVTDGVLSGPVSIDTSGLTLDTSGLTIDTSGITVESNTEHYHIVDFASGDVTSNPVALSLTFTGSAGTTGSGGGHTHSGSSLTFTDSSYGHFHNLSGHTDSVIGTVAITITNTLAFAGNTTTTDSTGAHTHAGSSLTISNTGAPLGVALIPYIRL